MLPVKDQVCALQLGTKTVRNAAPSTRSFALWVFTISPYGFVRNLGLETEPPKRVVNFLGTQRRRLDVSWQNSVAASRLFVCRHDAVTVVLHREAVADALKLSAVGAERHDGFGRARLRGTLGVDGQDQVARQ